MKFDCCCCFTLLFITENIPRKEKKEAAIFQIIPIWLLILTVDWYWQISIVIVILSSLEKSYADPAILDIKVLKQKLK